MVLYSAHEKFDMRKPLLLLPIIISIILVSIPSISAQSDEIPSWIKGVANFWVEGGIDDTEFIEALEFLIDQNIIKLGENVVVDNTMSELQEENTDLKEKLDNQEKDWQNIIFKSTKDWENQSNEYEQEIIDLEKRHEDKAEVKKQEYRQAVQELEDKIKELEK